MKIARYWTRVLGRGEEKHVRKLCYEISLERAIWVTKKKVSNCIEKLLSEREMRNWLRNLSLPLFAWGAWGSVVVKALRY